MSIYQEELQRLRPDDEIEDQITIENGYDFIGTASHGYLVVPKEDKNYEVAKKIVSYGYTGSEAIYLEEDCEIAEFEEAII